MGGSPASASGGFEKKLNKMLTRVSHTAGGSVRSEFEQRLYHEMSMFMSSGAARCFQVTCMYDDILIGGAREGGGLNGLGMIHEFYSAQQNIAEKGTGGEYTFAEVMAANSTLSVAEFSKVGEVAYVCCVLALLRIVTLSTVSVRHGAFSFAERSFDRHFPNDER